MDENKTPTNTPLDVENETLPEIQPDLSAAKEFTKKPKRTFIKKGPLSAKEKLLFVITIFVIILVGAGLIFWMNSQTVAQGNWFGAIPKPAPKIYYSPLSGTVVANEAAKQRPVTAVMIENSPDARPQSGLAEADVVFEAVAEGGITRFIALYQPSRPSLIGPVRSLRPYYAEWAAGFDPSVAHVGGSPEALTMIRSGNYGVDLDQFFNSGSYWRATDRYAPHNVYTNSDKLDALIASKNKTSSSFVFAPRVDEKKAEAPNATLITINVSTGIFSVSYNYDAATNTYFRKQGGVAHTDREKGQIAPKVVVALKTNIALSSDGSHMNIATSGTGQAYVFQNGTITEGTWSKADAKGQLFIKDSEGKEITLARGQTWITTVGNERTVSWQ